MESEKMGNRKKRQHHRSSMLLTWHFAVRKKNLSNELSRR